MTNPITLSARAIYAANHAASTEQTRYYINGVYTHSEGTERYYVATDGRQLIKITTTRRPDDDGTFSGINILARLLTIITLILGFFMGAIAGHFEGLASAYGKMLGTNDTMLQELSAEQTTQKGKVK